MNLPYNIIPAILKQLYQHTQYSLVTTQHNIDSVDSNQNVNFLLKSTKNKRNTCIQFCFHTTTHLCCFLVLFLICVETTMFYVCRLMLMLVKVLFNAYFLLRQDCVDIFTINQDGSSSERQSMLHVVSLRFIVQCIVTFQRIKQVYIIMLSGKIQNTILYLMKYIRLIELYYQNTKLNCKGKQKSKNNT